MWRLQARTTSTGTTTLSLFCEHTEIEINPIAGQIREVINNTLSSTISIQAMLKGCVHCKVTKWYCFKPTTMKDMGRINTKTIILRLIQTSIKYVQKSFKCIEIHISIKCVPKSFSPLWDVIKTIEDQMFFIIIDKTPSYPTLCK